MPPTSENPEQESVSEASGAATAKKAASRTAAKKTTAKKTTASKSATAKTATKTAASKSATSKTAATKTAAKKTTAKKAAVAAPMFEAPQLELPEPKPSRARKKASAPKDVDSVVDLSATVQEHAAKTSGPAIGKSPAFTSVKTEEPVAPPARLATTAVLFQAPEPVALPPRTEPEAGGQRPAKAARSAKAAEKTDKPGKPERQERAEKPERAEKADRAAKAEPAEAPADGAERSADDDASSAGGKKRRRGGRGRRGKGKGAEGAQGAESSEPEVGPKHASTPEPAPEQDGESGSSRRRRRRRGRDDASDEPNDEVTALKGSTRLEAKKLRRREGRDAGRRRMVITESEFLARRESVTRTMVVREREGRTQIAVLEDGVLVEHYVSRRTQSSMVGNVYLGRVQNVLPSMEAAFVDVGKGRNAVLYAGEVNWDAAGLEGQPRRIEQALSSGDSVLVQVTKDPIGHKGARLTSQITLAGRYLVFVPGGGMSGISRKLPDTERARLKKLLSEIVPDSAGVIVRTAAEGASEDELRRDVERLSKQWQRIEKKTKTANSPALLQEEPDLAIRVIRDIFNEDFAELVISGDEVWNQLDDYIGQVAPDLAEKMSRWTQDRDVFSHYRIDEQLAKGMDRKVWLPSGGSLVIDRTEAMTVIDVNTGKFTGAGGTLEETVTRNNLEAAEEIVRQLRLRDIGGIIVIDFIDMVLESNRDLVLRRLIECLGRDRTRHQVAEVTSLGLVQMTRKRVGQGLVEAFSEPCEACGGRGFIVHSEPVEKGGAPAPAPEGGGRRKRARVVETPVAVPVLPEVTSEARQAVNATLASIAAAAAQAHDTSRSDGAPAHKPDEERIVGDVDEIETDLPINPARTMAVLPDNLTTIPGTDILVFTDPVPAKPAGEAKAAAPDEAEPAQDEATPEPEQDDEPTIVGDVPADGGETDDGGTEGEQDSRALTD